MDLLEFDRNYRSVNDCADSSYVYTILGSVMAATLQVTSQRDVAMLKVSPTSLFSTSTGSEWTAVKVRKETSIQFGKVGLLGLGLGLGVHIRVLCKLADANNSKLHTLKVRLQRARQIHAHPL